ncbi:hypothetical protein [Hominenteromicrobium sp.]|uniref:hypothetical protein n=1 Tax=Hominenteromicrobium sp. TaxID=3073581 RepID=UPI003AB1DC95
MRITSENTDATCPSCPASSGRLPPYRLMKDRSLRGVRGFLYQVSSQPPMSSEAPSQKGLSTPACRASRSTVR